MSTTNDDTAKVMFAAVAYAEGGHQLSLKTVAGVDIEFLLDDTALAVLALTSHLVAQALKAKVGEDPDKIRVFNKEGVLE